MLDFLHPNLIALISACFMAFARLLYKSGLNRISPTVTVLVINLVSVQFGFALYYFEGRTQDWAIPGVLWFFAVGLCSGVLGRLLNMISLKLVGLVRTSVLSQTILIWSACLSVVFLNENLSPTIVVGTLAIMSGLILVVYERDLSRRRVPFLYYLVPVLAAALYSLGHLFRKFGLIFIPSSGLGMGFSNAMAIVLLTLAIPFTKNANPKNWDFRGILTVFLGGIFQGISAFCLFEALRTGQLVQVLPLNRLSVLLVLLLSWLFLQKQENVTLRIFIGGVLSVLGAFLIISER